jgi:hypothetical protein
VPLEVWLAKLALAFNGLAEGSLSSLEALPMPKAAAWPESVRVTVETLCLALETGREGFGA